MNNNFKNNNDKLKFKSNKLKNISLIKNILNPFKRPIVQLKLNLLYIKPKIKSIRNCFKKI
ncbi:MAG: hypothetical protein G3R24_01020 [gamma proteobacterium endosymbiont of Trioza apicalis]